MTKLINKTVIVLGIARSGTSLTSGMLNIMGVHMGKKLTTKSEFNPKGAFEDRDFMEIENKIFISANENYYNFANKEKIILQKNKFDYKIKKLIEKKGRENLIWGWKTPHTFLTLDLFLPYLKNPHFIIVFRNPIDNANSIKERIAKETNNEIEILYLLRLVNYYTGIILDIINKKSQIPSHIVSFENLVLHPKGESKKIAGFLGIEIDKDRELELEKLVISQKQIKLKRNLIIFKKLFSSKIPEFVKRPIKNSVKLSYSTFKNNFRK